MIKTNYIFALFLGLLLFPATLLAQEEQDPTDMDNPFTGTEEIDDIFQQYFFEGLKQKAIENYELALDALREAEKKASSEEKKAVVRFEMGKNYVYLKEYTQAEEMYKSVLASEGDRLDVLEHLYDLYHKQSNYEKSLEIVLKLIPYDENYKEDLANLYTHTEQYDKALDVLNELEILWGESDIRNALKARIYKMTGNTKSAITELEEKISSNPKNEKEYLNLIFLYSEQNEKDKAFEVAKNLLKSQPDSRLVHLALYKFYLDENQYQEAIESMKVVFSTSEIDKETKYKVLNDFIQFVDKNPEYEDALHESVELLSDKSAGIYEQLGLFYVSKNKKREALSFYEKGIESNPENYNLLKNTILLQIDFKKFEEAQKLSDKGLEIFPAQALLYLLNGVANNGLGQNKKAIDSLEMGMDFVYDDPKMEKDFYEQLSIAYQGIGNLEKSKSFSDKANKIKVTN